MNKTTLHWSYLNFKDVPMDLYLYEDLEEVYLKENFITAIPKWLLNVTTLKFIHLAGNNLSAIPEEMYLLENLEFLDVSNNQIRELPKTIGLMDRLQRLNVSGNELTELPAVDELRHIAAELMKLGHGLVVTDESPSQLERLMEMFGINSTKEMRIQYRSLLFSVKESLDEYVSGVAVHPEVLDQTTPNGCALHCQLRRKNVLVGVTVDKGLVPLLTTYGEYTTQGMDGLAGRCAEYKDCGCDFTMWRAQFNIGEYSPSYQAIMDNANNLAKFAAISQSKRMLPILEVDVVPSDDNDMERAEKVAETILIFIFKSLCDHHVNLEGTILKFPALNAGTKCTKRYSPGQISKTTLRLLRHVVPASVGGIILHVDGKTEDKSLCLLNAAVIDPSPKPWPIIFSFDGILQSSIMMAWAGQCKNMQKGQQEFLKMLDAFSKAAQGAYVPGSMKSLADQCYCKRAFKALKTKPDPLPDDCVRFDEICRPPIVMPIAPAPATNVESAVVVAITAIKTEDTVVAVGAATELVEVEPAAKVEEAKSTTEAAPEDAPTEQTENPPTDSQ